MAERQGSHQEAAPPLMALRPPSFWQGGRRQIIISIYQIYLFLSKIFQTRSDICGAAAPLGMPTLLAATRRARLVARDDDRSCRPQRAANGKNLLAMTRQRI